MKNKIEKIKTHFSNKYKIYISSGIGLMLGALIAGVNVLLIGFIILVFFLVYLHRKLTNMKKIEIVFVLKNIKTPCSKQFISSQPFGPKGSIKRFRIFAGMRAFEKKKLLNEPGIYKLVCHDFRRYEIHKLNNEKWRND